MVSKDGLGNQLRLRIPPDLAQRLVGGVRESTAERLSISKVISKNIFHLLLYLF
jgi:hypothetical protein